MPAWMPWLSLVIAILIAINPVGLDFLNAAFSGEALSRNIAQPIVWTAVGLLCLLALVEVLVRRWLAQPRRPAR